MSSMPSSDGLFIWDEVKSWNSSGTMAELDFSEPEWPPRCPQCHSGDIDLLPGQPAQCTRCHHHWPMQPPENVTGPVHYVHDSDHAGGKETKG